VPPNKRTPRILGPDGRERPAGQDARINEWFAATFRGVAAERVLDYLKSITINAVAGPEQSDAALRHLEGSIYLVGIIETRINLGVKQIAKAQKAEVRKDG